jgi:hypothetical protein
VVMFFAGLILFFLIPILGGIIAWIGCIIWAMIAVNQANAKISKAGS